MNESNKLTNKALSVALTAALAGSSLATPSIALAEEVVKDKTNDTAKELPAKENTKTEVVGNQKQSGDTQKTTENAGAKTTNTADKNTTATTETKKETTEKAETLPTPEAPAVEKTEDTKKDSTDTVSLDQTKLNSLISECRSLLNSVKISEDGKDILKEDKWITSDEYSALNSSVAVIAAKSYLSQTEIDTDYAILVVDRNSVNVKNGLKEEIIETPSTPVEETQPVQQEIVNQNTDVVENNVSISEPVAETNEQATPENNYYENTSSGRSSGNSSSAVRHYQDLTTEKFISSICEEARQTGQDKNLYASVMIAQAILESGSGSSELSQAPNNNLFGIKGVWTDKDGKEYYANYLTQEDDGTGSLYSTRSNFRAYPTTKDSLEDYADLLTNSMADYYSGVWKTNAKDYKEACQFLQGKYATSTTYAENLISLIETYDLTRFDEKLDYAIQGTKKASEDEMTEYLESDAIKNKTQEEKDAIKAKGEVPLDMNDYTNLQAIATSYLGTDYVWGGNTPETGFDCSGLVQYTYKEALGYDLSRTTYTQCNEGIQVSFEDLQMGDLLFFENSGDIHHVAMYLGDGNYIHAPQSGDVVKITSMEEYAPTFAVRIADFKKIEVNE